MADYLVKEEHLTAIADAYREVLQTEDKISFPEGFVQSVQRLVEANNKRWIEGTFESYEDLNLPSIGLGKFSGMTNLAEVNFPNVSYIDQYGFRSSGLLRAEFPGVYTFGDYCFEYCRNLEEVIFTKLTSSSTGAFCWCSKLRRVEIPLCTRIGGSAFQGCSSLEILELPSVTAIEGMGFYSSGLKVLYLGSPSVATLANSALQGTPIYNGEGVIYVPPDLVDSYKENKDWSSYSDYIASVSSYPRCLSCGSLTYKGACLNCGFTWA